MVSLSFVTDIHFYPNLKFADETGAFPSEVSYLMGFHSKVRRVELTVIDKDSSLLRNKFYAIGPSLRKI